MSSVGAFQRFTGAVARHFGLPPRPTNQAVFRVLVIERRRRRITNIDECVEALRRDLEARGRTRHFLVEQVDLETLDYAGQLRLVRDTTIFVGLHGAGLTHLMFLPAEAIVVEIKPGDFGSYLFRNLAKLCGKLYLSIATEQTYGSNQALDHDYTVSATSFVDVVGAATTAALNFGKGVAFSG